MLNRLKEYQKKHNVGLYPIAIEMGISEFPLYKYCHQDKYKNLTEKTKQTIERWIEVNC